MLIISTLLSFLSPVSCDSSYPWQIGFQDAGTPNFEGIVELHDTIFFYLVIISFLVFWMMSVIMIKFSSSKVGIVHKYHNHGTIIELIWTITPALILIAIAFPSFKLLYLMDYHTLVGSLLQLGSQASLLITRTKPTPIKNVITSCTALTAYGPVYSTVGLRLNNWCRNITMLTPRIRSILLGGLLGDGGLAMSYTSVTPYYVFTQTTKRFWYCWGIFLELSSLCQKTPTLGSSTRYGVTSYFMQIHTRSYSFLKSWYDMFYPVVNGKRTKVIPNFDLHYLDALALAVWAMDDGAWAKPDFYFHTKGFTYSDVYKLAAILHYNFGIVSTVQNHSGMPVIYITRRSMPLFISIVQPHFYPGFYYKLGLDSNTR